MAQTIDVIRDRIASVCASTPFLFTEAVTPLDFDLNPSQQIDQVFRVTSEAGGIIGGFNYSEERTDLVQIWLARKHRADVPHAYRQLLTDASSLRAAVIRDGIANGGDYCVPQDGSGYSVEQPDGREFLVLRLTVPVNFDATV